MDIILNFGFSQLSFDSSVSAELIAFLNKRNIQTLFKGEFGKKSSETLPQIVQDSLDFDPEKYLLVFPSKQEPQFLSENPDLQASNFNPHTLMNNTYPEIFGMGNFLFPECTTESKLKQSKTVVQNLKRTIDRSWFDKENSFAEYQHQQEIFIFSQFSRVLSLSQNHFDKNFFYSKMRAWSMLNSLLFRHLYWNRKIIRLAMK